MQNKKIYKILDIEKGDDYYAVRKKLIGIYVVKVEPSRWHQTIQYQPNGYCNGEFRIIPLFLPRQLYGIIHNSESPNILFRSVRLHAINQKTNNGN
jgi:hypothetical protein